MTVDDCRIKSIWSFAVYAAQDQLVEGRIHVRPGGAGRVGWEHAKISTPCCILSQEFFAEGYYTCRYMSVQYRECSPKMELFRSFMKCMYVCSYVCMYVCMYVYHFDFSIYREMLGIVHQF